MPRSTILFVVLTVPSMLHGVTADTLPQVAFNHKDWEITCDNTRTCRAAGYQTEDVVPNASVLLTRPAGPNQPVVAELQLAQTADEADTPATLQMTIGRRTLGAIRMDRPHRLGRLSPQQTAALLDALPKSDTTDAILWSAGQVRWGISKMGANAVLLKMDEVQGRLGTPGALIRKGNRPETSVLPALPRPVVVSPHIKPGLAQPTLSAPQLKNLLAELRKSVKEGDCERLTPESGEPPDIRLEALSAQVMLVSAACWVGAYNTGDGYWVANRSAPYSPRFITASANDHEDGVLSGFQKGRGIGDCIASETWHWDGKTFVHTAASTSGMCRQFAAGGAWDFPTLVTEVRRTR
jgi:hypothetical protein